MVALLAALAVATLSACGEPTHAESAPPRITDALTSTADTPYATAGLQPVPASTVESEIAATQLEVVHGKFLGIGTGSSLADALRTFGVPPIVEDADHPLPLIVSALDLGACLPQPSSRWVIYADALTMIFEGRTASTARLTTWMYTGGPAIGFSRLVVSGGLTIDGTREAVLSRFPNAVDRGGAIDTGDATSLSFGIHNGTITWFGRSDCSELFS